MPIQPGHIYLAVPDRHLILADGFMRLGRGPRENLARPAIDPLFRSAAAAYGPRVIGVVLSGMLSDGASGLEAIKRCGGLAMVQDPQDAIADEMPRNALRATKVDLTVPAMRLGDVLSDLVREPAGWPVPVPPDAVAVHPLTLLHESPSASGVPARGWPACASSAPAAPPASSAPTTAAIKKLFLIPSS